MIDWKGRVNEQKRQRPVGAGLPTGQDECSAMKVESQNKGPKVQEAQEKTTKDKTKMSGNCGYKLIVLNVKLDRTSVPLRALVDSGASNKFKRMPSQEVRFLLP